MSFTPTWSKEKTLVSIRVESGKHIITISNMKQGVRMDAMVFVKMFMEGLCICSWPTMFVFQ